MMFSHNGLMTRRGSSPGPDQRAHVGAGLPADSARIDSKLERGAPWIRLQGQLLAGQPIGTINAFVRDICHIVYSTICYICYLFPPEVSQRPVPGPAPRSEVTPGPDSAAPLAWR